VECNSFELEVLIPRCASVSGSLREHAFPDKQQPPHTLNELQFHLMQEQTPAKDQNWRKRRSIHCRLTTRITDIPPSFISWIWWWWWWNTPSSSTGDVTSCVGDSGGMQINRHRHDWPPQKTNICPTRYSTRIRCFVWGNAFKYNRLLPLLLISSLGQIWPTRGAMPVYVQAMAQLDVYCLPTSLSLYHVNNS